MEERNVTFDTAKLAKSKGFPQTILRMKEFSLMTKQLTDKHFGDNVKAPTQTILQTWLREVHKIQVYAYSHTIYMDGIFRDYVYSVTKKDFQFHLDARDGHDSFEEAMEAGLLLALSKID